MITKKLIEELKSHTLEQLKELYETIDKIIREKQREKYNEKT